MEMEKILALDELPLKEELEKILHEKYENVINSDGFLYAEGEVPVLLIAHLDTVHKTLAPPICWSNDRRIIMSPHGIGGDDRCGVYMILKLINELKCHVLFCEQEEVGCLGAKAFCKAKIKPDVNYIIEFDRKGSEDSVFYSCDNDEFETFVNSVGFKTAYGSCSDISQIAPYLGIAAVNLSSGYYNAHQLYEFIDMYFVERNIEWAKKLITTDSATRYKYIEKKYTYTRTYGSGYTGTTHTSNVNKAPVKIKKMLMKIDNDNFWIYEEGFYDCMNANYYVDRLLDVYIEVNGICEKNESVQILNKNNLQPPEYNAKKADLKDVLS